MAASALRFDVPATYLRGFSVDQQLSLNRALGFVLHDGRRLQVLCSVNGALDINSMPVVVTKAGVCAMTLAAPTAAQNGMTKVITSNTANAHTVTATGLFQNGVVGGAKTTATFAAFAGASMTIMAYEGKWNIVSLNAVTVA